MYVDIKWIKLSVTWYKSDDIQLIRKLPDGDTIALMFVMLLAMAGDRNEGGYIPYSEEDLAALLDMQLNTVRIGLRAMESRRMIDFDDGMFHITNWDKYQSVDGMEKIKEQNRIRKANQRERQRQQALAAAQAPALPEPEDDGKTPMDRRFERFWKAYPRKVGKGAAEKSFKKYKPDDSLTERMIASVEAHKKSDQWKKDGGQFIPHPATWLNQRRWEDEIETEEEIPFYDPNPTRVIRDESIEDWN